jgi:hypothetical protein
MFVLANSPATNLHQFFNGFRTHFQKGASNMASAKFLGGSEAL